MAVGALFIVFEAATDASLPPGPGPPSVSKTTYSTPTEASPNAEDDEDLLQYPDRARWVRVDLESIFLHVVDLDLVN